MRIGKIHPLYCAIRAHGVENFEFQIIEECDEETSDDHEISLISKLKTCNREFGYNIEPGGNGGKTLSIETRQRMSASRQGKKPTLGHHHSDETRLRMSISHRGKSSYVMTDEISQKISAAISGENHPNFGKHLRHETCAMISRSLAQPVERLNEEGNVIALYASAKEASEKTGISRSVISVECKLNRKWRKYISP